MPQGVRPGDEIRLIESGAENAYLRICATAESALYGRRIDRKGVCRLAGRYRFPEIGADVDLQFARNPRFRGVQLQCEPCRMLRVEYPVAVGGDSELQVFRGLLCGGGCDGQHGRSGGEDSHDEGKTDTDHKPGAVIGFANIAKGVNLTEKVMLFFVFPYARKRKRADIFRYRPLFP